MSRDNHSCHKDTKKTSPLQISHHFCDELGLFSYLCPNESISNIYHKKLLIMKRMILSLVLMAMVIGLSAQTFPPTKTPQLQFVMQLRVTLGETYEVGNTQHGRRIVIPITGGTFEGPLLKGEILNGGADYQLASHNGNRTQLEAIYSVKTDDGVYIHVRNRGIIYNGTDENGQKQFYFKAAPQFEAPQDSRYAWLNNALFVCEPEFTPAFKGVILNVWKVV